jgi:uncharacterized protein GlcG (DUF336 family)
LVCDENDIRLSKKMINAAETESKRLGLSMVISVVDEGGNLDLKKPGTEK